MSWRNSAARTNNHARRAADFIANESRIDWHDQALWYVREKRDRAAAELPEWEELRELASQVKGHVLSKLRISSFCVNCNQV